MTVDAYATLVCCDAALSLAMFWDLQCFGVVLSVEVSGWEKVILSDFVVGSVVVADTVQGTNPSIEWVAHVPCKKMVFAWSSVNRYSSVEWIVFVRQTVRCFCRYRLSTDIWRWSDTVFLHNRIDRIFYLQSVWNGWFLQYFLEIRQSSKLKSCNTLILIDLHTSEDNLLKLGWNLWFDLVSI